MYCCSEAPIQLSHHSRPRYLNVGSVAHLNPLTHKLVTPEEAHGVVDQNQPTQRHHLTDHNLSGGAWCRPLADPVLAI